MDIKNQDHPGVIAFPPLIFAACLTLGLGLHWLMPVMLSPRLPLQILGGVLLISSASTAIVASFVMRKAGTNVRPDKPATTIVTAGPFRFTRNPMYLSLCLLNTGIALLVCGLFPLLMTVVLATILQWGVIVREEKYLTTKFGPTYVDYCRNVRRWL